jgi:hypothetical protein
MQNILAASAFRTQLATVGLVACLGLVGGCSSSGHHSDPSKSGSAPGSVPVSAGGGTATDQITKAYEVFFSNTSTTPQSEAALQHGDLFVSTLDAEGKTSYATKSSATVSKVVLGTPNSADVTFSVISNGVVVLKDTPGKAVREGGTWKVAAQTFCALLTLQGNPPRACSDASVTALPN